MTAPAVNDPPKLPEKLPIVVAGRAFRPPVDMTYEHDMYLIQLLNESGLDQLVDVYNPLEDDLSDLAKKIILKAFATGKMFRVLATALVEDGVEWSFEEGDKNELFFRKLKDKTDKKALQSSIVMVLLSFIVSGVLSSRISRNYSLRPNTPLTTALATAQFDSVGVHGSASESGITSSVPLPATTRRRSRKS